MGSVSVEAISLAISPCGCQREPKEKFSLMEEDDSEARLLLQCAMSRLTVSKLIACNESLRCFHAFLSTGDQSQRNQLCLFENDMLDKLPSGASTSNSSGAKSPQGAILLSGSRCGPESTSIQSCTLSSEYMCGLSPTSSSTQYRVRSPASNPETVRPKTATVAAITLESLEESCVGEESGPTSQARLSVDLSTPERCNTRFSANIIDQAEKYFQARLGVRRRYRTTYLVRAVQGFLEADEIDLELRSDIVPSWSDIFPKAGTGLVARLNCLHKGRCQIRKSGVEHEYADRFCFVFLDHDLQQLDQLAPAKISRNGRRKAAAFDKYTESNEIPIEALRAARKSGGGYRHLLNRGGPGFLLAMGGKVSTIWERKLSKPDINLVLEFLETELPEVYERGKALDGVAAKSLLNGFFAYGWTAEELAALKSDLVDRLCLYVSNEDAFQSGETWKVTELRSLPKGQRRDSLVYYEEANICRQRSRTEDLSDASLLQGYRAPSPMLGNSCGRTLSTANFSGVYFVDSLYGQPEQDHCVEYSMCPEFAADTFDLQTIDERQSYSQATSSEPSCPPLTIKTPYGSNTIMPSCYHSIIGELQGNEENASTILGIEGSILVSEMDFDTA